MVGLFLGTRNMTLKSLQQRPVVVDKDYMGQLKILAQAPQTFVAIAPTEKIAQLLIFSNVKVGKVLTDTPQGEKGFGHFDHAYWVQWVTSDHPEMAGF
jgi:dUTPase